MKFFETLFDPFASAKGPPPTGLINFGKWIFAGTGFAIFLQAAVSVLVGLSEIATAWLVGLIVNRIDLYGRESFFDGYTWPLIAMVAFLLLVRPLVMILQAGLNALALGPGLTHVGVWRLHQHTLGQSLDFFEEDFAGRINQKQMQTATSLGDVVMELLNAVAFASAMLIGGMVALGSSDIRLSLVLAVWFALYVIALRWGLPRIRAVAKERAEARSAISGNFVDSISNISTVKLFAHTDHETEEARKTMTRFRNAALVFGRATFRFRIAIAFISMLLPICLLGSTLYLWKLGAVESGAFALAGILAARMGAMTGWFSFMLMGLFNNIGVVEDGIATLAKDHTLTDDKDAEHPENVLGEISFDKVDFHYGREEGGGLNGFDLTIRSGEKVALVGRSGAGKSTVLSLLLRLREVEGGAIRLDNKDIRTLTQDGLRRHIGMVTQDTQMFNRSTRDNILYGRPDASEEDLIAACKQAQAYDFIQDLRDGRGREGFDAYLGERGVKLSGGQRQRIAIARVILKNAPILVLDEATSALDSEVEAAIQSTFDDLMEGKTVIAIAHRLSTIAQMDRIIVLEDGRILEEGSHDELLAANGQYAKFWNRQSGGFIGLEIVE